MKKFYYRLLALLIVSSVAFSNVFITSAQEASNDYHYYEVELSATQNAVSSILKDEYWAKILKVSKAEVGINIAWKNAVRNVRVAMPTGGSLDGMHAVFSNLSITSGGSIGFTVTDSAQESDYRDTIESNYLARLPFVMAVDFNKGMVTLNAATAYYKNHTSIITSEVYQSDNLTAANLQGKEWSIRFDKDPSDLNSNDPNWNITIADEHFTVRQSLMFDPSSEIDLNKCWFALNPWRPSGNTMSIDVKSFHDGEKLCADVAEAKSYLSAASNLIRQIDSIGEIKYNTKAEISSARNLYDNMPSNTKSLITNYRLLQSYEEIWDVVAAIHDIGTVNLKSSKKLNKVNDLYQALSDEKKLKVSNYEDYTSARLKYMKLVLEDIINQPPITIVNTYIKKILAIPSENTKPQVIMKSVDVDGGTQVSNVTKTVTTTGGDGSEYLWIIFTVAGSLLALTAIVFFVVITKDKRRAKKTEGRK